MAYRRVRFLFWLYASGFFRIANEAALKATSWSHAASAYCLTQARKHLYEE